MLTIKFHKICGIQFEKYDLLMQGINQIFFYLTDKYKISVPHSVLYIVYALY